jgi:hypothetical protein
MSSETCRCESGDFCHLYHQKMFGRRLDICRGTVLTPEKCEAYRQRWKLEAAGVSLSSEPAKPATPEQFPCIYREGLIGSVPCQVCGQRNKMANLYACALHDKCTVGSHGVTVDGTNATARVKVCISCDDINGVG